MSENCCYSFLDLFRAARGRDWSEEEREEFNNLPQEEKNRVVREMVAKTGGKWACEDRTWMDGKVYTAFWMVGAESDSDAEK